MTKEGDITMELRGAIDLHLHTAPDVFDRSLTDTEAAEEARAAGMRAILLKSHHVVTADRAQLVSEVTDFPVYGGLALNHFIGGLNPFAVETAIRLGAKEIWMPTIHARNSLSHAKLEMFKSESSKSIAGITVENGAGRLRRRVFPVLEMVRDADIILGTGHLAPRESLLLLQEAKRMGIQRLLLTHPLMHFTRLSLERMQAAVTTGAKLELDSLSSRAGWPEANAPAEAAEVIRKIGPRHIVIASDGGQAVNPRPTSMLKDFAEALEREGIPEADLRIMMGENPAWLLGL